MEWSPKTQPTPANVRKRITAAQEAINGAMDLVKANPRLSSTKQHLIRLDNACGWLVAANRGLTK